MPRTIPMNAETWNMFAVINTYHISRLATFLEKLVQTPDGDGSLLDHSMVLYGSSLSDANEHNYDPLPVLLAGKGAGRLQGNRHLMAPAGTPMANLLLGMLHSLDVPVDSIGDLTQAMELT